LENDLLTDMLVKIKGSHKRPFNLLNLATLPLSLTIRLSSKMCSPFDSSAWFFNIPQKGTPCRARDRTKKNCSKKPNLYFSVLDIYHHLKIEVSMGALSSMM
jgi:hypothetical protein